MAQFQFLRLVGSPPAMQRRTGRWRRRAERRFVRPRVVLLEDRLLLSLFYVTNTNNDGAGSLHQAIEDANDSPGANEIRFDIEPGGPETITLTSPLPNVLNSVFINGTSQAGWVRDPLITVTPAMMPYGNMPAFDSNGLTLTADGCEVKGLVLQGFGEAGLGVYSNNNLIADDWIENNGTVGSVVGAGIDIANMVSGNTIGGTTSRARNVIGGNSGAGVFIHESSTANLVEGNYIGTDAAGTTALANVVGVDIADGAGNNTVGGTAARAGNLISGNANDGIFIESGVTGILVQGNKIGTNATGAAALANGLSGVEISGSSGNTVGGALAGAGNLISGNSAYYGILMQNGATANLVQANQIGTNAAGTAALANGAGIGIGGASNNTIGGTVAGAGNLISGNVATGIFLASGGTTNLVQGNKIGTNAAGTAALANGHAGVGIGGASNNTIGGTVAGAGNLISGNGFNGITIAGGATANLVQGNKIGTNAAGTDAIANLLSGVEINGSSSNTVGGTAAGAGNLISGNNADGIFIKSGATTNLVQGNQVGTDVTGTSALGNHSFGVQIASSGNTVGGTTTGAGNLLSGNGFYGILIESGITGVLVQGNRIGTNAAGTAAVANGFGVVIEGSNNTVGGTAAGAANLISGNTNSGIDIGGSSARGNLVQGNRIGTNAAGTVAVANGTGVGIDGSNNTVGGTAAGAGNLISGNRGDGIAIGGSGDANLVQGNQLGTDAAGTAALANLDGVYIQSASNNTIGGTVAGAGNTIAFNHRDGVLVASGTGNAIRRNSIFSNSHLGIELFSGANNNQPAPSLTSAMYVAGTLTVHGTMTGAAGSHVTLEFFANPAGDPEGKVVLGSLMVTIGANGSVNFTFTVQTNAVSMGMLITATATDATNDTSQFSAGRTVL